MSVIMIRLLACTVLRLGAAELAPCDGEAEVTDASCDAMKESSLLQAFEHKPKSKKHKSGSKAGSTGAGKDSAVTIAKDFCQPRRGTHTRVRKNIFDMDSSLWKKFKEAFRSFYSKGLYDKWAVEHTMHYDDNPEKGHFKDHTHALGFLAFHRGQIQDLETELMQEAKDCSMTFPFWDWSMDVATFKTSEIWSDEYMGNAQGCVVSGLPGGWEYPYKTKKPCVERKVEFRNSLPDSRKIALFIQDTPQFDKFVKNLELTHNGAHAAIGGNMAGKVGKASPSDPMFYLHHAFIDAIYFKWQQINDDTSAALLRDDLVPMIGKYNQGLDCVYLPVHRSFPENIEATCVHYAETENAHAPNSALLQAYNADSDCVALQKQIGRNECSVEELEDLVCVGSLECTLDEANELEANAKFEHDVNGEKPDEIKVDDNDLHDLNKKTKCKTYSTDFTPAEARHCYKCDVPCKGGKK